MPFFSIVIPVFNRRNLVVETINSVLMQEYTDFEVIVVDDGSTDETGTILQQKYGTDKRIKIIRQDNLERGAARNNGFRHASGEYVVFFDSDDRMHPDHLVTLHRKIVENNSPDFIATKFQIRKENKLINSDLSRLGEGYYDYRLFLNGNPLACNVCVKRKNQLLKLFEEDRRYAIKEDWLFLLQNLRHQKLFLADKITITMIDHSDRSMKSDHELIIKKTFLAFEWIKSRVELSAEDLRVILAHINYFCSIHSYIDYRRIPALKYLGTAIRINSIKRKYLSLMLKILIGKKLIQKIFS